MTTTATPPPADDFAALPPGHHEVQQRLTIVHEMMMHRYIDGPDEISATPTDVTIRWVGPDGIASPNRLVAAVHRAVASGGDSATEPETTAEATGDRVWVTTRFMYRGIAFRATAREYPAGDGE